MYKCTCRSCLTKWVTQLIVVYPYSYSLSSHTINDCLHFSGHGHHVFNLQSKLNT